MCGAGAPTLITASTRPEDLREENQLCWHLAEAALALARMLPVQSEFLLTSPVAIQYGAQLVGGLKWA